jgi:phosphoribosylformylglycinamidine synthase
MIAMKYKAKIEISLKPGHFNPEGETIVKILRDLRYRIEDVIVAKIYEVTFEASSRESAQEQVDEMCRKLLANPVKDDYYFTLVEVK